MGRQSCSGRVRYLRIHLGMRSGNHPPVRPHSSSKTPFSVPSWISSGVSNTNPSGHVYCTCFESSLRLVRISLSSRSHHVGPTARPVPECEYCTLVPIRMTRLSGSQIGGARLSTSARPLVQECVPVQVLLGNHRGHGQLIAADGKTTVSNGL